MFRRNNIAARLFERQICSPAPGTSFHCARRFYENIVPSHTIFDVECPDILFRKFSEDGQYLITFSRNHQDLIVYRPTWLTFSCSEQECEYNHDLPPKANKFESYFSKLYALNLASTGELICKDFFLYAEKNKFGLFATSTAQILDAPAVGGAIPGVPSIEKITFHLVRLEDGVVLDQRVFCNDYISLAHSMGAYLYDDLVAIVSLRYQRIHILQIRESGNLVDVRSIGEYCREDDELFLNSSAQRTAIAVRNRTDIDEDGFHNHQQPISEAPFLGGLKQRLLSFIFRGIWNEEKDPALRMQYLKKKFYFHFQDYADLGIWKVQFLDRHHLLIKFGSIDGGVGRSTDNNPAFFAVYNMETTQIVSFYQSSAEELYALFELFCDHFHTSSKSLFYMKFLSTHSNNIHALEQLRSNKNKTTSFMQFVKKMLSVLPMNCQSQSPSPYFDHSLFRYDEKLISATDRHRQSTDHPIKFILRRHPKTLKFKIHPGPESGGVDTRAKKISSFLFHPILPLAISVQQTVYLHPAVVNIHFRL
ncbi:Light-mediated development protein DET1 [Striga hermonthica]|uniref:Light-mediated development protein DET1 n=1 Tax=Striga hermonthica TaxID=68872 RepID=A0A9N7NTU6_STRHE|nr:Light-mediated development protein DET1 [Striga hermonthica]